MGRTAFCPYLQTGDHLVFPARSRQAAVAGSSFGRRASVRELYEALLEQSEAQPNSGRHDQGRDREQPTRPGRHIRDAPEIEALV